MVEMLNADVVCHGRDGLVGGLHGIGDSVGAGGWHTRRLSAHRVCVDDTRESRRPRGQVGSWEPRRPHFSKVVPTSSPLARRELSARIAEPCDSKSYHLEHEAKWVLAVVIEAEARDRSQTESVSAWRKALTLSWWITVSNTAALTRFFAS